MAKAWCELATRLSVSSPHPKYRMAAVLVKGGRVLSHATNGRSWGAHAELRALKKCANAEGAIAIVIRDGGGCSEPCDMCWLALREAGVRKVFCVDQNLKVQCYPM
jgi:pyrimidine deaminase RibD-like protein